MVKYQEALMATIRKDELVDITCSDGHLTYSIRAHFSHDQEPARRRYFGGETKPTNLRQMVGEGCC